MWEEPLVPNSAVCNWNTNLVEIELSSLCLPFLYFSVKRQLNIGTEECLCRDNLFFRAPEAVTTAKWRDVLEREQFSSQIVAITVSQNGEFIARYC